MIDFSKYVGIPFVDKGRTIEGCDCWGLLRLVYSMELGVQLPTFSEEYESCRDTKTTWGSFNAHLADWEQVQTPVPLDGIFFNVVRNPHVGIVVANNFFLHTTASTQSSTIERLDSPIWRNRIVSYHRLKK